MVTRAPRTARRSNMIVEIERGALSLTSILTWFLTGVGTGTIYSYPDSQKENLCFLNRFYFETFLYSKVLVILIMGTLWMPTPSGCPSSFRQPVTKI